MAETLILASGSQTRADMLRKSAIAFEVDVPRVDEEAIKSSLLQEGALTRDVADALAEAKARKVAGKRPGRLVLASDQVLDYQGSLLSKPVDEEDCLSQLKALRGDRHMLLSAAVIFEDQTPVWRHISVVRLRMRDVSDHYLEDYVARNWHSIRHSVGGYKIEEEGVRLFHSIEGDHFSVLGLPLLQVLSYLTLRGTIPG